jgi:hypothetical protein
MPQHFIYYPLALGAQRVVRCHVRERSFAHPRVRVPLLSLFVVVVVVVGAARAVLCTNGLRIEGTRRVILTAPF